MERAELIGLGITYDMLEEALFEAGGTIGVDGHYPINSVLQKVLQKLLGSK